MSGHVHLLCENTTLGATLQRQLQAALFHVTISLEDEHAANVTAIREQEPEVIALVRSPRTSFDDLRKLKKVFSHHSLVIMDPVPSDRAKSRVLGQGADAYLPLPVADDDLTLRLTAQVLQARRLDDSGSTEDVLRLLGFDPLALAMPDSSMAEIRLALCHEDEALETALAQALWEARFEPKEHAFAQPLPPGPIDGWVVGAVSPAGWRATLAAIAQTRSTPHGRHVPIILAGTALPTEDRETLARLNIQDFWLGSEPDASLALLVEEHVRRHRESIQRREALVQSLDLAITDSLTNLFNQRFLVAHLPLQMQIARQSERPLSLALLDLDGFKGLNGNYGHLAGDQFLIGVADHLRWNSRVSDSAIRMGGDEFALILPNLAEADAHPVVERLIDGIATIHHAGSNDGKVQISASVGLVTLQPDDWSSTGEALIAAADARLYAAKKKGGNQIVDAAPS